MPATSVAGGLTFTNLGAVSTTFTAPGACATQWKNGQHGSGPKLDPDYQPWILFEAGTCGTNLMTECFPHGEKVVAFMDATITRTQQMYYSPAFDCPIGWSTAGVAAMSNGSPSISGIFSGLSIAMETRTYTMDDGTIETLPPWNWRANRITSALGPDETVLVCCPSGFTAHFYAASCHATFDATSLSGTQGCATAPVPVHTSGRDVLPEELEFVPLFSLSLTTETWSYGSDTFTATNTLASPTGKTQTMDTDSWTFDGLGRPTGFSNRTTLSQMDVDDPDKYEGFVGVAEQPWLVFIHGGDGSGSAEDNDNDNSAASRRPDCIIWAVAGATLAGAIAFAAL